MTSTSAAEGTATLARGAVRPLAVVAVLGRRLAGRRALVVGHEVLLASPGRGRRPARRAGLTADFWGTVATSFVRIVGGFAAASVLGTLGATLAASSRVVDALVTPALAAIRSAPVVSFIILVLIWVSSDQLALVISFLMVLPIIYTTSWRASGTATARCSRSPTCSEVPRLRRLPAVDLPAVLPFFTAACRIGVGLAWKSGIAAEVIGLAEGSIGERLYEAKILLSSADLFAWTAVIIAVSFAVEQASLRGGPCASVERRLA